LTTSNNSPTFIVLGCYLYCYFLWDFSWRESS